MRYWSDFTPVAGQQLFYGFDTIGNRTTTLAGGDATGGNLRASTNTVNNLNQITQRGVPGAADQIGAAYADATVTVNDNAAYRKGEYYQYALALSNGSGPVWQVATNKAVKGGNTVPITNNVLCPPATQTLTYAMKYFEVVHQSNLGVDEQWHLGSPIWVGTGAYVHCLPLKNGSTVEAGCFIGINFPIQYDGPRLTFFYAGSSGVPVVHKSLEDMFKRRSNTGVKLLPCLIGGKSLDYSILVVEKTVPCLDTRRSGILYHTSADVDYVEESDGPKIGSIKDIYELKVLTANIESSVHIFRLMEAPSRLIVSESLRRELEDASISGMCFVEV